MRRLRTHNKGFTLIELLVVIAIIGLLSSVVFASLNSARVKARDAKRKSDLSEAMKAIQFYYDDNGTYIVSGTGYNGCSCGWFDYQGGSYSTSIAQGLQNAGYVNGLIQDPTSGRYYMKYQYNSSNNFCLFARLEDPSSEDIARYNAAYGQPGYSMNYAVCN